MEQGDLEQTDIQKARTDRDCAEAWLAFLESREQKVTIDLSGDPGHGTMHARSAMTVEDVFRAGFHAGLR